MIIDVILVALAIVAAIWGAHKGGVKIIAGIVSLILAFVLAYVFANSVGEYVKETSFGMKIEQAIQNKVLNSEEENSDIDNKEQGNVNIYNEDTITKIENMIGDKIDGVVNEGKEALVTKITEAVFYGIGFILTFITVKIALAIVFLIIGLIFKLPLLKLFNKLTGAILEVVLMLLKVWILLGLISFIAPLDFMNGVTELINGSVVTKLLYEHNIIVSLIIGRII